MYIGIDLGTSSLKTILMNQNGIIVAEAAISYSINSPKKGWAEQDPQDWVAAAYQTIREILQKSGIPPAAVKAVSFSGQMHGLVAIDKSGKTVRPAIIWADQRSTIQLQKVNTTFSKDQFAKLTANPVATGFMLASWLWMQENEPELCKATTTLLLPKDYLRFVMTGEIGTEPSDASATALYDPVQRHWQTQILAAFNIPIERLPGVFASTDIAGGLTPSSASACGLPAGIPIIFGAGDQAAQAIGNGIIQPGTLSSTIGTGGQLFLPTSCPNYDPELRLHLFCHAVPNQWHFESAILSAGLAFNWLKQNILSNSISFQQLADEAAKIAPTANQLLFLPDLAGNRTPHMDSTSTGVFAGLTIQHSYAHLARAVMEGVVMEMHQGLCLMESLGANITQVIASGGGTHHPLWMQLQADIYNRPILRSQTREAAAVGAAILAAVGSGGFSGIPEAVQHIVKLDVEPVMPQEENVHIYQDWMLDFNNLYLAQKTIFKNTKL